jgi:hypothetical protein
MPTIYEIRIEGHLDPSWSEWLEGMTFKWLENGDTLLKGPLPDQSAMFGLLNRIRDMNLKLVSIEKRIPTSIRLKKPAD